MIIIGTASRAKSWPPPAELVWARPEVRLQQDNGLEVSHPLIDTHLSEPSRSSDCSASARVGRHSTLAAYLLGSEQWGGLPPLVIGLPAANLVGVRCRLVLIMTGVRSRPR